MEATCKRMRSLQANTGLFQCSCRGQIQLCSLKKTLVRRCSPAEEPTVRICLFSFLEWIIQEDLEAEFVRSFKRLRFRLDLNTVPFHHRLIISSTNLQAVQEFRLRSTWVLLRSVCLFLNPVFFFFEIDLRNIQFKPFVYASLNTKQK